MTRLLPPDDNHRRPLTEVRQGVQAYVQASGLAAEAEIRVGLSEKDAPLATLRASLHEPEGDNPPPNPSAIA